MSENGELHVVFGASGGAGGAIVRALAARGKRVRAVTRSGRGALPHGVEAVRADAADKDGARRVCAGATVVYHAVNVPYPEWTKTLPPVMDGLIAAAGAARATLVYADNLYAYGPVDGPMTEDLPPAARTRKGRLRAQLAETLLDAHRAGTVRAVIGRGSDYYGPGVRQSAAGERLFPAVLSGDKAMWAGSLDQPHSLTFIDDFARVLVTLGERNEALGQVWHAPPAEPLTGRQFIELAFAEAGRPPKVGTISPVMIRLVGLVNPMVRELGELVYEFEAPFVLDGSTYLRAFGGAPTPHREAIRATLSWFAANPTASGTPRRATSGA
ncbi:MAG: NAD-dependent epimerase/dehydratase family protein [Chloroflexota bacterium]|nr:NAD-dependent epimerase/dehydratase family protein [Chloroflexota bacterium]